jgi:hypothetical protein
MSPEATDAPAAATWAADRVTERRLLDTLNTLYCLPFRGNELLLLGLNELAAASTWKDVVDAPFCCQLMVTWPTPGPGREDTLVIVPGRAAEKASGALRLRDPAARPTQSRVGTVLRATGGSLGSA